MKTVVLFHGADEIAGYLADGRPTPEPGAVRFVALTPLAIRKLEELQLPFTYPEQYYEVDREYQEMSRRGDEELERFIAAADAAAGRRYPGWWEAGMRPFAWSAYNWKIMFDVVKLKILEISQVIRAEQPTRVCFGAGLPPGPVPVSLEFDEAESLYAAIIPLVLRREGIPGDCLRATGPRSGTAVGEPRFRRLSNPWPRLRLRLKLLLLRGLGWIRNWPVVALNPMQNLHGFEPVAAAHGLGCVLPNRRRWERRYAAGGGGDVTLATAIAPEHFSFLGLNYYPVVAGRVEYFMARLPVWGELYHALRRWLSSHRVRLVLADTVLSTQWFANLALVAAAHREQIPVAVWAHGGFIEDRRHLASCWGRHEISQCDHYFVYGPAMADVVRRHIGPAGPRVTAVGCRFIENQRARRGRTPSAPDRPTVVYVMSQYHFNTRYLGWDDEEKWSDNRHYYFTRQVIRILRALLPETELIIKTHGERHNQAIYRDLVGGAVSLIGREEPLAGVLDRATLAVYDFLSTSFFEAAITPVTLIVYTRDRLAYPSARAVRARAYCCAGETEFRETLLRYRQEGDWAGKNDHPDFGREFLNDGAATDSYGAVLAEVNRLARAVSRSRASR